MNDKKEKLVVSGNAFYEIDLDCIRKKEQEKQKKQQSEPIQKKRQ